MELLFHHGEHAFVRVNNLRDVVNDQPEINKRNRMNISKHEDINIDILKCISKDAHHTIIHLIFQHTLKCQINYQAKYVPIPSHVMVQSHPCYKSKTIVLAK